MRDSDARRAPRLAGCVMVLALASLASTARAQTTDAVTSDAQTTDAQTTDAQTTDAQTTDAPVRDAQTTDAQTTDAQTTDAPASDAQTSDAQTTDAPTADAQTTDAPAGDADTTDAPRDEGADSPSTHAPEWRWPGVIVWEVGLRLFLPPDTGFDRALVGHGYDKLGLVPGVVAGFAIPAGVEWLWLGGQLGVRGRTWSHAEHEDASMVAADLLAMVRARFLLGERVELGAAVGGGLGWAGVWVNGVMSDQVVPRFNVQGDLSFRIGRHFAFGPRVGWDYLVQQGLNGYGHAADAGGPYFGLSLEGRE